jgi:uncharacterized membrane protein YkoI
LPPQTAGVRFGALHATEKEDAMKKRTLIVTTAAAALALGGTTYALGGSSGLVFDDGHYVCPGTLDDGKDLLPETTISLSQAVANAQQAATGNLGQVDLERNGARVVYVVDVGNNEVQVDAGNGSIVAVGPQS